jgi:hypothetical protein
MDGHPGLNNFQTFPSTNINLVPFILSLLGFVAVTAALFKPRPQTIWGLRLAMVLIGLGRLLGVYEHLRGNIGFALEIQPNATLGSVFFQSFFGANPLLAPGILGIIALLALAATYYHPALGHRLD